MELSMQRRLVIVAYAIDVLTALLLLLVGLALLVFTATGLKQAAAPGNFAGAMLVGSFGTLVILLAAAFGVHALWCHRRLRPSSTARALRWSSVIVLAIGPIAALGLFFAVGSRLVG